MDNSEILNGGNSNQVIKEGKSVIRNKGVWSHFVHQLLQYLQEKGFKEAPIFLGQSDNQERLSFIEGEVGNDPLQPYMLSDDIVIQAGKLLRKLHNITQDFEIPPNSQFFLPVNHDEAHEVICHNDFAPYNCVFKDDKIVGIIDFDTAAPGKRLWDIAYAVYRFVPLVTDKHCQQLGWQTVPDRVNRLGLFCDAYGLTDRTHLIETVIKRIEALVEFMRDTTSNLDHIPIYLDDLQYIRENYHQFDKVIQNHT